MNSEITDCSPIVGGHPAAIAGAIGLALVVIGIVCIICAFYWGESWFTGGVQIADVTTPANEALPTERSTVHWVAIGGVIASTVGAGVMAAAGMGTVGGVGRVAKTSVGFYIGLIVIIIIGIIIALAANYYDKWYFKAAGKDKKVTFAHIFGPAGGTAQTVSMWVGIGLASLAGLIMFGRLAFQGGKKGMNVYTKNRQRQSFMSSDSFDGFPDAYDGPPAREYGLPQEMQSMFNPDNMNMFNTFKGMGQ